MSDGDDEFSDESLGEVGKELLQVMTPTEEDIRMELNQEQLHKLCRRVKSYVAVSKWNPVYDFQKYYNDQGRFKGQSQRYMYKLLIKTYERNPQVFDELQSTQAAEWQQQWRQRKKNSIMLLNLWEYDEKMKLDGKQDKQQSQMVEEEDDGETLHAAQLSDNAQQTATTAADQATPEDIVYDENMTLEGEKEKEQSQSVEDEDCTELQQSQSVEDKDHSEALHAAQFSDNAQQTATTAPEQPTLEDIECDENMTLEGEKEKEQSQSLEAIDVLSFSYHTEWEQGQPVEYKPEIDALNPAQVSGNIQQTAEIAEIECDENMMLEGEKEKEQSQMVEDEDDGETLPSAQLSGNAQQTATTAADQATPEVIEAPCDPELISHTEELGISGSVNSIVDDLMRVNSESITVYTETLNSEAFPSQPIAPLQPDELCLEAPVIFDSENYEGFNNSIPLTSTQDPMSQQI